MQSQLLTMHWSWSGEKHSAWAACLLCSFQSSRNHWERGESLTLNKVSQVLSCTIVQIILCCSNTHAPSHLYKCHFILTHFVTVHLKNPAKFLHSSRFASFWRLSQTPSSPSGSIISFFHWAFLAFNHDLHSIVWCSMVKSEGCLGWVPSVPLN